MMRAGRLGMVAAAVAGAAAAYWAFASRRPQVARERLSDYRHRKDVDSMAEDSFPASDPPSFTPTTGEKKASAG
jgi:hypothetical protein